MIQIVKLKPSETVECRFDIDCAKDRNRQFNKWSSYDVCDSRFRVEKTVREEEWRHLTFDMRGD
jgi:hypothetical protein